MNKEEVQTVQGMAKFLLMRILGEDGDATKIANQTTHSTSSSRDVNSQSTKDGTKRTLGAVEQEIEASVLLSTNDDVDKLKEAHEEGKIVELWDINSVVKNVEGKYKATYYQGYISDIEDEAPSDDGIEVSITFAIEGVGQRGYTALSVAQEAVIQYAFVEAVAGTANEALAGAGIADEGITGVGTDSESLRSLDNAPTNPTETVS
ncbi:phage major tail protein, TP901-1 family [Suicoccus acidiformans]|uniref:Phage major tail protein, TP901-1 family n=1 Tax=Suicoccus acidiformans TaxID=2036206 RepID=A0A347WIJ9_9LACT|nr:phage major tail protein, TP901-1 family [Suicoccus acidiformans]AXY24906.1 phage major tail protein, TP901-1 family [Suicoccus acidiformans]